MTPCPGSCNAWWRNLTADQQDASDTGPRQGDPVWCHPDHARIRAQLAELDDLAALLHGQITGYHEQPRHPSRDTGHTPSPSATADDLDELTRFFFDWEDGYRDWHNAAHPQARWLTRPRRGHLAPVITGTVSWLVFHLDGILACELLAADFGLEVAQRHRELVAKTRAGTGRRLSVVPCPQCQLRFLAWVDGYDGLRCANCNRHVPKDEHAELADAATERHLQHA